LAADLAAVDGERPDLQDLPFVVPEPAF
jgi:hypothetical protein